MSERVLVLGATGRFGTAVCEAFRAAGWLVSAQVRPGAAARAPRAPPQPASQRRRRPASRRPQGGRGFFEPLDVGNHRSPSMDSLPGRS